MTAFLSGLSADLIIRFAIDAISMATLIFGLYYRRTRDRDLATTAAMFNIFAFAVLTILSSVQFSVAAGFGLFAILALFSLRSEQISKTEISYFFGAIAIAVITSVQGTSLGLVVAVAVIVLLSAWLLGHPSLLRSVASARITLDRIDEHALADPERMKRELSERLGVTVLTFSITELNYVNDLAQIIVNYRAA